MLRYLILLFFLGSGPLMAQVNLGQGLLAYYPFNGNANDASGNGHHGTLFNGVSFVPDRFSSPNSAVHFDGVDDFIEVLHNGILGKRSAFSFVVNFKTESLTTVQTLLARRNRPSQVHAQFQTFINWSVHPGFGYAQHYSNNADCNTALLLYNVYVNTGASTIMQDQWHCVVGTFDGTFQKIYLDGVLKESIATPLPVFDSCTNTPMTLGKYTDPDPQAFKGTMDDVRIYDRALTPDEVMALCTQVIPDFEAPDTVCINNPVTITNNSINGSTYYWNFCVADMSQPPVGANLGNPGSQLSMPVFMDYTFYNGNYYGFLINHNPGKLIRLNYGNSLLNTPSSTDLGNFGGIIPPGYGAEGIQLVYNENRWYAIIVGGYPPSGSTPRVLKVEFGANLLNPSPTATDWGNIGNMLQPVDLHVFKENNNWYGLTVNAQNNSITRFNFTNSFDNTPTGVNLGGFGMLDYPTGIYAVNDKGYWRVFITNSYGGSKLVRLDYGSSLLNTPTAVNLGQVGAADGARDISIMNICDEAIGFVVNGTNHSIYRLNFTDLANLPSVTNLGNIGNLNFPHSIGRLFRVNDDLYTFITNVNNNTITRLRFPGCSNSTPASSTAFNPPPVVYSTPGTYNINLTINDGLPTQASLCKQVVVLPAPVHTPTQNIPLCPGNTIKIGSPVSTATYTWNTGATTDSILVNGPGTYWVESDRYGCAVRDSFNVFYNIDSARMSVITTACNSFSFSGLGYTNTHPIVSWQWYFGDGGTASTQNTSHTYSSSGTFPVKLVITDINGCKDSAIVNVITGNEIGGDFNYTISPCDPMTVQFNGLGTGIGIPDGDFGDGSTWTGNLNPLHTYTAPGNYLVQYYFDNGICRDTIRKTISLGAVPDNVILTPDTTICFGATKKLITVPALGFCWSPTTYLDNPNSPEPTTSTPHNITYYYNAEVLGNNLISNGNFSSGNSGFTSAYNYSVNNTTEGQYYVGTNPNAWNAALTNCPDHTTGNGNMLLVNGSAVPDAEVWKQSVAVTPNTNYAFSTWIASVSAPNPAQLQFTINGKSMGSLITASTPVCNWTRFYTTWNSGTNTSAIISIINKNTIALGNDFALDDISFATITIKRDSVKITVDTARIQTTADTTICKGTSVQLSTTGAQQYAWSPASGLSNPAIGNPIATPAVPAQYIVTGTNANGCVAKDTINVSFHPVPPMTVSNDTSICRNTSVQLFAAGGTAYSWSPPATLTNPGISNPVASPVDSTKYYVIISYGNSCDHVDSVQVNVLPLPSFAVSSDTRVCLNDSVQLNASGGDTYSWQPSSSLSNSSLPDPFASPLTTTTYTVLITESVCNQSTTLTTEVQVLPLPTILANKSNDIDCSYDKSQLVATGAAQYSWLPAGTLNNAAISNPVASPATTTTYTVTGKDINGCKDSSSITVNVDNVNKGGYLMPSAFTPNNDGLNDCYRIKFWGIIYELEFSIYNRWGERVFYTTNPGFCWDGTFRGVAQPSGVFVYMIKAKTNCESEVFRKGTLTLIR